MTAGWGALIVCFGLLVGGLATSVVEGINRIGSLFYGPLLAAFACGILDRRARGPAVLAGVAAGLALNVALAWGLGTQIFWIWWNLSGLLMAVAVTYIGSRLLAPPMPAQLQGTTLDAAGLRAQYRAQRPVVWTLAAASVSMTAAARTLGTR